MKDKLAIIVPFRDRQKHLDIFVPHMHEFLKDKGIDYDIFIAEQADDRPFNYGKLCNVVVKELPQEYNYFAFHDVDMLPMDDECDYSFPEVPIHLATQVQSHGYKLPYPQYFGGVVLMSREDFEIANGYSNEYWGYGFEDLDLLYRIHKHTLYLEKFYDLNKVYSNYDEHDILPYRIEDVKISPNDKTHTLRSIKVPINSILTGNVNHLTKETISKSFTMSIWFNDTDSISSYKNIFTFDGLDTGIFLDNGKILGQVWDENENHFDVDIEYQKNRWNHCVFSVDTQKHKLTLQLNRKKVEIIIPKSFSIHPHYKELNISDIESEIEISTPLLFNDVLDTRHIDLLYYEGESGIPLLETNFGILPSINLNFGTQNNNFDYSSHTHKRLVLDNGKNFNHLKIKGDVSTFEHYLSVTDEIWLPIRFQGKYNSLTHDNDEDIIQQYYKHDPDIEQNADIFFNEVLTEELDTGEIGLNTTEYTVTEETQETYTVYKILT